MTQGETHAQDRSAPRTVAGYRLLREIGVGGMSAVFQSFDVTSGNPVAIKLLADHLAGQPEFVGRFYREARLSRVLEHPTIVQGYASGFDPEVSKHYLVLEYIDGPTAHGALTRMGKLPVGMVVRLGIDIARALAFLHERQYVHRDVKPDNILLHPSGVAKLADLGLAKRLTDDLQLTAVHQGVGTTYYMPYEQAVNANLVDGRSDIFALGVTLYHLLTGEIPFVGTTHDEVIREKARDSFHPLGSVNRTVPKGLAALIDSMLACDPRARVQSAAHLAEALTATGLATRLPVFADDGTRPTTCMDPTPEMPTRADLRLPPEPQPPMTPPVFESFKAAAAPPTRSPKPKSGRGVWPWVLGAGAVLVALLAHHGLVRSNLVPVPPSRTAVVQETPNFPDGLPDPSCQ